VDRHCRLVGGRTHDVERVELGSFAATSDGVLVLCLWLKPHTRSMSFSAVGFWSTRRQDCRLQTSVPQQCVAPKRRAHAPRPRVLASFGRPQAPLTPSCTQARRICVNRCALFCALLPRPLFCVPVSQFQGLPQVMDQTIWRLGDLNSTESHLASQ
jgi:hypothetical protein